MHKPVLFFDMDGVVADFVSGYKIAFNRDAYADDNFTINNFCMQSPNFFRNLPILERGRNLFNSLKDNYKIIVITTPMNGMVNCKRDKIDWIKDNFGEFDIIFSEKKQDYVVDETSILIDDMTYNLGPWEESGGTAINFMTNKNNKIIEKIEIALGKRDQEKPIDQQIREAVINLFPTDAQKKTGNYKKGDIEFKKLKIKIENPKGSFRVGFDNSGKKWFSRMNCHYGYIANGQIGSDQDKIDCFIGPHNKSIVFIVNQGKEGMFDEHKIMLGFESIEQARDSYLKNYPKGWEKNIMSIEQTNTKKLRKWLTEGNTREPY